MYFEAQTGAEKIKIQVGERLLMTKNNREIGVKNGELGSVDWLQLDPQGQLEISMRMDDGRKVLIKNNEYQDLQYGYSVTTHKAQGVTVDQAFVMIGGRMLDKEMAYVQASRTRIETRLYIESESAQELADRLGLDIGQAAADKALERIFAQTEKSRAKDTTLDYSQDEEQEQEQEQQEQQQPEPGLLSSLAEAEVDEADWER